MMPPLHLNLLVYLARFLHLVAEHAAVNKMNAANLAMVFAPNLLRPPEENFSETIADTPHASQILETLIHEFNYFFGDFVASPCEPEVEEEISGVATPMEGQEGEDPVVVPRRRPKRNNQVGQIKNMTMHFRQLNTKLKQSMVITKKSNEDLPSEAVPSWDHIVVATATSPMESGRLGGPRENPFLKEINGGSV
jgi:hypothetical protein